MRKVYLFMAAAVALSLTVWNCTKDETTTKTSKITGVVSGEVANASGAVVTLSSSPNASVVVARAISDSVGNYTFIDVKEGTYYVSAKYNTANTNNLKSSGIKFTSKETMITLAGADLKQDISLVSNASTGTDVVEYVAVKTAGKYTLDQTHSFISFSFPYDSANAPFGGHFASFGLNKFKFDEANLANCSIDAWVNLTTIETGSPTVIDTIKKKTISSGRDGLNGCITKTFKVVPAPADTFYKGAFRPTAILDPITKALIPSAASTFVSTSIAAYGDGYVATGKLTLNGLSKDVKLYFRYLKGFTTTATSGTTVYSSFDGFFVMQAKSDFNIISGHVKSVPVTVSTSLQFITNK